MSPAEMLWRARSRVHARTDRLLLSRRQRQQPLSAILASERGRDGGGVAVADTEASQRLSGPDSGAEREWYSRLLAEADRIVAHRLSYLSLADQDLGTPIDWHRDHRANVAAPKLFAPTIDYRDFHVTGDCKYVWEPNRHHQFVLLGRAYRASGDRRYAEAMVEQIDSWLVQNPYGIGMNWRSPLEMGVRLINWVWAIELIQPSGLVAGELETRLLNATYRHVWDIVRKFSRASSANNHLIGEAAGVFVATSYFRNLRKADGWRATSKAILSEEILRQTCPDGGGREQALGYHLFVLQFFAIAGLIARRTRADFPDPYWARLEAMFDFAGAMSEGGEALPMFGDADEGYVLDLGGERGDWREWMAVGAILFERPHFKAWAGRYSETAWWLLGPESRDRWERIDASGVEQSISSRAFPDTGYYLLQWGGRSNGDRISVVFDCGELGYLSIAPHGHADALSFTLRAFGLDVIVDPGTYDYFTYPEWRTYFRSTRGHNTVIIDDQDQSEMLGPFMWGKKAKARCVSWEPSDHGGKVVGEHDGYTRLREPVLHRRTVELDGQARVVTIRDEVFALGTHDVRLYFHLAEHCTAERIDGSRYQLDVGPGGVTIELDPRLAVDEFHGSEDPIAGWVSRGYHRKTKSTTLVGRCRSDGKISLVCRIEIGQPRAA